MREQQRRLGFLQDVGGVFLSQPGKLGGCIRTEPANDDAVPADPYVVSKITADDKLSPFTKHMNAFGIQLLAGAEGQEISDSFMCHVAKANAEMYRNASDPAMQRKLLENMYRFRA